MRILFLTRLFWPHIGGVERHAYEVALRLAKRGYEITLVTEQFQPQLSLFEVHDGLKIYRIPVRTSFSLKKFQIWKWFASHIALLIKADVIVCHDVFFWFLPFRLLFLHKKVITVFHGYEGKVPPAASAIRVRKLAERWSTKTIQIGNFIEKWYKTHADVTLYGGVEESEKLHTKIGKVVPPLRILFVGRLENDIGCETYLQSLEAITQKKIPFELVCCGDGSLRSEFEKFGKVVGFTENLSSYLASCNIVFASSYLSMFEALIFQKPIFAAYTNELKKDYLLESPFADYITVVSNAEDLLKQIQFFVKYPFKFHAQLEKGYEWARKQSWNKIADCYEKIFKEL